MRIVWQTVRRIINKILWVKGLRVSVSKILNIICTCSLSDDDDDDDSEEDRDTPTYTAVSNTPTRITLTAKGSQKRKRGPNKIKVKVPDIVHVSTYKAYFGIPFWFWILYWFKSYTSCGRLKTMRRRRNLEEERLVEGFFFYS